MNDCRTSPFAAQLAAMKPLTARQVADITALGLEVLESYNRAGKLLGVAKPDATTVVLAAASSLNEITAALASVLGAEWDAIGDLPLIDYIELIGDTAQKLVEINAPVLQTQLLPVIEIVSDQLAEATRNIKSAAKLPA